MAKNIPGSSGRYGGVVRKDCDLGEGLCALLGFELGLMEANVVGMGNGEETDPLHDFRVAMRRFRATLRLFRKPLTTTSGHEQERVLSGLADQLSRARDADVRVEFLRQPSVVSRLSDDPIWPAYRDHVLGARLASSVEVERLVRSPGFAETMKQLRHLVDVELPAHFAAVQSVPMKKAAARRFKKMARRLKRLRCPRKSDPPEVWHRLRRTLRRYRYWTESLAPFLGGAVPELANRIDLAAEGLGGLNDMNVYLNLLPREPNPPSELRQLLKERRKRCRIKFAKDWGRLHGKKLWAKLK